MADALSGIGPRCCICPPPLMILFRQAICDAPGPRVASTTFPSPAVSVLFWNEVALEMVNPTEAALAAEADAEFAALVALADAAEAEAAAFVALVDAADCAAVAVATEPEIDAAMLAALAALFAALVALFWAAAAACAASAPDVNPN